MKVWSQKNKIMISFEKYTPNKHSKKSPRPFSYALHRFQHYLRAFSLNHQVTN